MEGSLKDLPQLVPFRRSSLKKSPFLSSQLDQRRFINAINLRNFINGQLYILFTFSPDRTEFISRVSPGPCSGPDVTCFFHEEMNLPETNFELQGLLIDNGKSVIIMKADLLHLTSRSVTVRLHKSGTVFHARHSQRYSCKPVRAVIRNGARPYQGYLIDFNPSGIRLDMSDDPFPGGLGARSEKLQIDLSHDGKAVFSGPCLFIRAENMGRTIILSPQNVPHPRHIERKYRNPRLTLVPKPEVVFIHPLTGRKVGFDIEDITTSGFSVMTRKDESSLIPGLIIDCATVQIAGELKLHCSCQVVYGRKSGRHIRYGFVINDIDVTSYNRLFNVLSRSHDPYARISYDIDMDSLWHFFFESGFIYPEKYTCIAQYKEDFKRTYRTLYHDSPDLFTSVTYQHNDKIYGHVSLIKAYEHSWLVHHLAAKPFGVKITGLSVLNQILNYFDGFDRMPSIGMRYMIFYFRPENRFPNFFFGGLARAFNIPSQLSLDTFAYLILDKDNERVHAQLPEGWSLRQSTPGDINELRKAYNELSGGLMVESFCLDAPKGHVPVEELYRSHGLFRKCIPYALLRGDTPEAHLIVDQSDRGINLSDLINSVKVIVPRGSQVTKEILSTAIQECGKVYSTKTVTVQVFPCEFMDRSGFAYKKKYIMWVLDTRHFGTYIEYIKDTTRFRPWKYLKRFIAGMMKK